MAYIRAQLDPVYDRDAVHYYQPLFVVLGVARLVHHDIVQINGAGFHTQAVNLDIPILAAVGKARRQCMAPSWLARTGAVRVNNNGPVGARA